MFFIADLRGIFVNFVCWKAELPLKNRLKEHFGKHRSLGRRNDNPDVYQFG